MIWGSSTSQLSMQGLTSSQSCKNRGVCFFSVLPEDINDVLFFLSNTFDKEDD